MRLAPLLIAALALSGCNAIRQSTSMFPNRSRDWRNVATEDDQNRLRDWRTGFVAALAAARAAGDGAEIDREGALLDPDSALTGGAAPEGWYRCRLLRLGARSASDRPFVDHPGLTCRVTREGSVQGLVMVGGTQRIMGRMLPDDPLHQVFLGTLMLPTESRAMQYGADEKRDVAGYFERIGPARWRLIMPAPHFGALFDVLELVPVAAGAAG